VAFASTQVLQNTFSQAHGTLLWVRVRVRVRVVTVRVRVKVNTYTTSITVCLGINFLWSKLGPEAFSHLGSDEARARVRIRIRIRVRVRVRAIVRVQSQSNRRVLGAPASGDDQFWVLSCKHHMVGRKTSFTQAISANAL